MTSLEYPGLRGLAILILSSVLLGCSAEQKTQESPAITQPDVTVSSEKTQPSVDSTEDIRPNVLATKTMIYPAPSSQPLPSTLQDNYLFDPNCRLPCWKGLTVGESTAIDVQYLLENDFGLIEDEMLLSAEIVEIDSEGHSLLQINRHWIDGQSYNFSLDFFFSSEDAILRAIAVTWSTSGRIVKITTPKSVIQQLLTPSTIQVAIEPQPENSAYADLKLGYDEQVILYFSGGIPAEITQEDDSEKYLAALCFNTDFASIALIDDPTDVFNMQAYYDRRIYSPLLDFEVVFETSIEAAAERITAESNPCFSVDIFSIYP